MLLVAELVLAELGEERREALVDFAQVRFLRLVECGAAAGEAVVVHVGQTLLFGVEARFGSRVVDSLQARKEGVVLNDLVIEGGEDRRHVRLDLLHRLVVHRRRVDTEEALHAAEGTARVFKWHDRVVEGCRRIFGGDGADFGAQQVHALRQGGLEVGDFDFVEARDAPVGPRPRIEHWTQCGLLFLGCSENDVWRACAERGGRSSRA